jgi:hypothetical protein
MGAQYWIQHISGQGKRYWAEQSPDGKTWFVRTHDYYLPIVEYKICSPPERWVDVTGKCEIDEKHSIRFKGSYTQDPTQFRRTLKQSPFPHIIIERKVID